MKYACITRYRDEYEIRLMCRVLRVSPSGYYAARARAPSARAHRDEELLVHVRAIHQHSRRSYGAPRIRDALSERKLHCGQKRVARIMRADGLRVVGRRKFRVTTQSTHAHPIAPNTLARQFAPTDIAAPNRVWASDLTYLWTREGWLYLAIVLDLGSRRVIGWALGATLDRALPLSALHMALALRHGVAGALHRHDGRAVTKRPSESKPECRAQARSSAARSRLASRARNVYNDVMTSRNDKSRSRPGRVGEPIQVYLDRPDRDRLERLAARLDVSKSDVLRRGLAALEALSRVHASTDASRIPVPTYHGGTLQPGVDLDDSASLIELMDQGDAPR